MAKGSNGRSNKEVKKPKKSKAKNDPASAAKGRDPVVIAGRKMN